MGDGEGCMGVRGKGASMGSLWTGMGALESSLMNAQEVSGGMRDV